MCVLRVNSEDSNFDEVKVGFVGLKVENQKQLD